MRIRLGAVVATIALLTVGALSLAGCSSSTSPSTDTSTTTTTPAAGKPVTIKIGTLAVQDSLPLWVAQEKGYFDTVGIPNVEMVPFQSAQEEQAAFTGGAIQGMMTDLMVTSKLQASGTKVVAETIMLGATIPQGRFAVVAAPNSGLKSITDLKGVPVGTASGTVTEYVLDKLAEEAGMAATDVKAEQVPKMPVRFDLLMKGQLKAASLPEPFVTLATQSGATILEGGDDTKATENLSQSVLTINAAFAESPDGAATVKALLQAWDLAVADINADPNAYRQTLVTKAMLPAPLANSYQVSKYPTAGPPAAADVQRVLDWMKAKGYLTSEVTPQDILPK